MATSPLMFAQNSNNQDSQDPPLVNSQVQLPVAAQTDPSAESAIPTSPTITPMMRAAMTFIQNSQPTPDPGAQIRTQNIAGHNILQTNSPGDIANNANNVTSQGLSGIASQYLAQKNNDNRQSFIQSVHQIMSTTAPQQDKMNALLDLQTTHGTDYGLGLDTIASKLGLNRPAPATLQDPAQRIQQLMKVGQLSPDQAHQTAVSQIGADYATKNPELGSAIQGAANQTVLAHANQVIQKQFGPGYEINPDWVTSGKGNMVQPKATAISNDANYNTLSPTDALAQLKQQNPGYAAQLQMYADGRGGKLSNTNRSPRNQQMIQDLAFLYPGIDVDNINQRVDTLKDFSSGKTSQQVKSLNTALGHLDTISNISGKLTSNKGWPITNSLVQGAEGATGTGDAVTLKQFNFTKQALSDEIATMLKGSAGTDKGMEGIANQIHSADTPEILQGVVKNAVDLIKSRLNAVQDQWGNTYNSPGDLQGPGGKPIISPASQKIINRLGATQGTESTDGNKQDYSNLWN